MHYKRLISSLVSITFLISCGSNNKKDDISDILDPLGIFSNGNNDQDKTFSLKEKKAVHNLFLTEYYWYEQVIQDIDYKAIKQPQELINALKVTPPDVWSFSMTKKEYEDYANQKTAGFGFGYTQNFTLYMVRIDSPAYNKLQRGDTILKINGTTATETNIAQASANTNRETTFTVLRNNTQVNVTITPSDYTFKVSLGKVIPHNGMNVGYLRYDSFTGSSVDELEKIFTTFKSKNISELVIDLRYNGGGSIAVASALLDNITNQYAGQRQGYLDWNDRNKEKNEDFKFEDAGDRDGNELDMKRVIFLVTKNSASASELVISALKPYLKDNIITIGTETHGKPVGMSGKVFNNNYYFLINFMVRNNADETTPFEGIPATCEAEDNLSFQRGDSDELMLKQALHYIDNSSCP
ncbi:MAG: S41 family peptidase [Sulfurovum sp.]|nr:S41 family peptidase [Sulfurovum sp.]